MQETALDLRYNIIALAAAIIVEDIATVEDAFDLVKGSKTYFNKDDSLDMLAMQNQGMTYREIAEVYGVTRTTIIGRIRRIKKDLSAATEKVK